MFHSTRRVTMRNVVLVFRRKLSVASEPLAGKLQKIAALSASLTIKLNCNLLDEHDEEVGQGIDHAR